MKRSNREAGFTLVELLVVILLVALLTGMAVPRFQGAVARLRLRDQAEELAAMLHYAWERARTEGVRFRLQLDEDEGCAWVERESAPHSNRFAPVGESPGRRLCVNGTLTAIPAGKAIAFHADGRSGPAEIHLRGSGGKGYTLAVKGILGDVEIREQTR